MTTAPIPSSVDLLKLADLKQRAARDDPAALAEAAVQFEALFIGMMLKSARDASLGEGIFDNSQTLQYLEPMDQQVALDLAKNGGFGIGKMLLEQLGAEIALSTPTPEQPGMAPPPSAVAEFPRGLPASLLAPTANVRAPAPTSEHAPTTEPESDADAARTFVARFAADASAAAQRLGIDPRLLLAQAALETGWGTSAPRHPDGRPTYNMFGIKAGESWRGERAAHWTVENVDGVAERKRAMFRAYPSSTASFADYVELIDGSPRYAAALERKSDPAAYVRALTEAGYATDPAYADKWLAIYHGDRLKSALADAQAGRAAADTVTESTQARLQR